MSELTHTVEALLFVASELGHAERLGRHEEQRLDGVGELAHAIARSPDSARARPRRAMRIVPNTSPGSACTSPCFHIARIARNAAACDSRSRPATTSSN